MPELDSMDDRTSWGSLQAVRLAGAHLGLKPQRLACEVALNEPLGGLPLPRVVALYTGDGVKLAPRRPTRRQVRPCWRLIWVPFHLILLTTLTGQRC